MKAGDHRRLRVHRGRAPALAGRAPRHRGDRGDRPRPRRPGGRGAHTVVGRRLPRSGLRGGRPGGHGRPGPGLLRPAPRGVTAHRARAAQAGRADRGPGGGLPARGSHPLSHLVRGGPPGPGAPGRGRLRPARALPERPQRRHPDRLRRLLPDGGGAGLGPVAAGRADRGRAGSSSMPPRASPGPGAPPRTRSISGRSTRTSWPTGS